jgi:hypothetical protein
VDDALEAPDAVVVMDDEITRLEVAVGFASPVPATTASPMSPTPSRDLSLTDDAYPQRGEDEPVVNAHGKHGWLYLLQAVHDGKARPRFGQQTRNSLRGRTAVHRYNDVNVALRPAHDGPRHRFGIPGNGIETTSLVPLVSRPR